MNSTQNEETFDWLTAMKLFAEGVEIEGKYNYEAESYAYPIYPIHDWYLYDKKINSHGFHKMWIYRRKPPPQKPDYTLDQGFQCGDIVMASDDGEFWAPKIYGHYDLESGIHLASNSSVWKRCRPLTKEEYARVKHE